MIVWPMTDALWTEPSHSRVGVTAVTAAPSSVGWTAWIESLPGVLADTLRLDDSRFSFNLGLITHRLYLGPVLEVCFLCRQLS